MHMHAGCVAPSQNWGGVAVLRDRLAGPQPLQPGCAGAGRWRLQVDPKGMHASMYVIKQRGTRNKMNQGQQGVARCNRRGAHFTATVSTQFNQPNNLKNHSQEV